MAWQDIRGHEWVYDRLQRAAAAGRLASTFLFVGRGGVGKRAVALKLAQSLLCETHSEAELNACGHCSACQQVLAGTHPDLEIVSKPADRSFIPLEMLIGDDEHRMREGLLHNIGLKPYHGGRKIAILDDADYLNQEGANCLLKTLEEPPPKSLIVLLGTSEQRQLPTIRSRCQIMRFDPLPLKDIQELLLQSGVVDTVQEAHELSELSGGSLEQARCFADPAVRAFRERWYEVLSRDQDATWAFAKEFSTFVDAAGKEAPPRRARMKLIAQMGVEYFRHLIAAASGYPRDSDPVLQRAVAAALKSGPCDPEVQAACIDRCLEFEGQVDANANQSTLIECVLDDLVQLRV